MDIRFQSDVTGTAAALSDHARRRLHYRLRHRSDRVAHVDVRLGSTGGRRGRAAVYCLMRVQLNGAPDATVVDIGSDVFDTIDRAADRVGRLAEHQLQGSARWPVT